jgi:hypothetical protein
VSSLVLPSLRCTSLHENMRLAKLRAKVGCPVLSSLLFAALPCMRICDWPSSEQRWGVFPGLVCTLIHSISLYLMRRGDTTSSVHGVLGRDFECTLSIPLCTVRIRTHNLACSGLLTLACTGSLARCSLTNSRTCSPAQLSFALVHPRTHTMQFQGEQAAERERLEKELAVIRAKQDLERREKEAEKERLVQQAMSSQAELTFSFAWGE